MHITVLHRVYKGATYCNFISAQQEKSCEGEAEKAKMKLILAVILLLSTCTVAVNSDKATKQGFHHGHSMFSKP